MQDVFQIPILERTILLLQRLERHDENMTVGDGLLLLMAHQPRLSSHSAKSCFHQGKRHHLGKQTLLLVGYSAVLPTLPECEVGIGFRKLACG